MQESTTNRPKRFRSRAERDQHYSDVFRSVVQQYVEIVQLPRVSAIQIDRDAPSRSRRLTSDDIHFKIDVERATEYALGGRPELEPVWFRLAANEIGIDQQQAAAVIHLCGRLYAARRLEPSKYYHRNAYPHRQAVQR